jgi:hypothetical protein
MCLCEGSGGPLQCTGQLPMPTASCCCSIMKLKHHIQRFSDVNALKHCLLCTHARHLFVATAERSIQTRAFHKMLCTKHSPTQEFSLLSTPALMLYKDEEIILAILAPLTHTVTGALSCTSSCNTDNQTHKLTISYSAISSCSHGYP